MDEAIFLKELAKHLTQRWKDKKKFIFKKTEQKAIEGARSADSPTGLLVQLELERTGNKKITRQNIISCKKITKGPADSAGWITGEIFYERLTTDWKEIFLIVHYDPSEGSFYERIGEEQYLKKFTIIEEPAEGLNNDNIDPEQFKESLAEHLSDLSKRVQITVAFSEKEALTIENRHKHWRPCFVVQAKVPSSVVLDERSESEILGANSLNAKKVMFPELRLNTEFTSWDIIQVRAMQLKEYKNSMGCGYQYLLLLNDNFWITPQIGPKRAAESQDVSSYAP